MCCFAAGCRYTYTLHPFFAKSSPHFRYSSVHVFLFKFSLFAQVVLIQAQTTPCNAIEGKMRATTKVSEVAINKLGTVMVELYIGCSLLLLVRFSRDTTTIIATAQWSLDSSSVQKPLHRPYMRAGQTRMDRGNILSLFLKQSY